ncbi:hypothetical protein HanHA300_Chr05g0188301 [Helianthus annuus]|nr:hypothetical protein HanHA300_Chr05g0188301 [Helianthus annuus]KAJ0748161.1 hypothetical protein HanOQP8_Chr05g0198211 [Helianthus annuus]
MSENINGDQNGNYHDHESPDIIGDETSRHAWRRVMSPEIVEVEEQESRTEHVEGVDVFVAVGKNDMDVVKWAVDHVVVPGGRVYLVHVFPPVTHIQTPGTCYHKFCLKFFYCWKFH